ncbi:anthocyanidin 3-o-glucosyltransferase 5 [Quercus suber]|uniref:Anthocyanidin 3-o-glucosyltransferase 5 n=1 Tax=Quercus suber TaxID=58331 RepID=A0AAW0L0Z7_QUESU
MESSNSKPHVVLVASPGVGHLVRVLELSNRLAANQNLHVTTFVVMESHSTATTATTGESQLVQSAKARRLKNQDIIELPPVTHNTNAPIFTRLSALMHEILPTLRSSISALKHNPTALVVDIFGTPLLEVADQFHMLKYVFVSSTWSNALLLYFPVLDKEAQRVELGELKEPIKMPGCKPIRPDDLLDSMMDRTKSDYKMLLQIGLKMRNSDGILIPG